MASQSRSMSLTPPPHRPTTTSRVSFSRGCTRPSRSSSVGRSPDGADRTWARARRPARAASFGRTGSDDLRTSVERYRYHFERNLAGVFRAERGGRIVESSEAFVRLVGAGSAGEIRALDVRELFVDPLGWQELVASLAPGVVISNQELQRRRRDGTPLTVLANLRETGGFVECLAIDITDRARAEEAERKAMRLRAIADLAAAAAHEISNPLTGVLTNLALLKLEGEAAVKVEKALEAGRRIQEILDRMTRIERVEMAPRPAPSLAPMIDIRKSSD